MTLNLSDRLREVLKEVGYETLTPVQERSLPALLAGRDVLVQAQTGSGKTAAFAIPILERVTEESRELEAIVLCPTRELSQQVAREIRKLGRKHKGLQVLVLTGGEPAKGQTESLRRGVHIVVGTPGRVCDHVSRGNLDFSQLKMLVLDEADRMLDMGFSEELKIILAEAPRTRQNAFFSATFPEAIRGLAHRHLQKPEIIEIAESAAAQPAITELVFHAEDDEKAAMLLRILKIRAGSTLIFLNQKAAVAELATALTRDGFNALALHGDLEQRDRDKVLAMFRNGSSRVLVATDVAARGLDIAGLDTVIQCQVPHEPEVYTHRIGRTGRAGAVGVALCLASVEERQRLRSFGHSPTKIQFLEFRAEYELAPTGVMQTLYISGGRKDKIRPGDILGALTGEAALKATAIGKIEIHDRLAYVAVASDVAGRAVEQLKLHGIKGRKFLVKMVDRP